MKLEQRQWTTNKKWSPQNAELGNKADLVLIFGETSLLKDQDLFSNIRLTYPQAQLFGCSTSGEIYKSNVFDNSVSTTAIQFTKTQIKSANLHLTEVQNGLQAGLKLAGSIPHQNLSHVLVLSVGLNINGSDLVKGLTQGLPKGATITGGLAGDQDRFKETLVISNAAPSNDMVAIIGLYGSHIQVGSASLGGWDQFGPERLITKSKANILYELDGKSALEVYKKYLGDYSKDLPGSALLFPLCLRSETSGEGIVRTVLAIDEESQSLTFAGDVPQGIYGRFMKANFDRLIEGAIGAAENSVARRDNPPELALLISCVGRKIVLKQRVEEEVEGVRDIFGEKTTMTGFYSYGEISPFTPNAKCELHNQTMTITTLSEVDDEAA